MHIVKRENIPILPNRRTEIKELYCCSKSTESEVGLRELCTYLVSVGTHESSSATQIRTMQNMMIKYTDARDTSMTTKHLHYCLTVSDYTSSPENSICIHDLMEVSGKLRSSNAFCEVCIGTESHGWTHRS